MARKSKTQIDAARLRDWRDKTGFTQREVATKIGRNRQTIYNYETGRHRIPAMFWHALKAIADV